MKFFTDNTVNNRYLLIPITKYKKMHSIFYSEVLIDPGVYELKKSNKYSWEEKINIKEFLDQLPDNTYFTADYPSDMNQKYEDEFIINSYANAYEYSNHSQYIPVVQSKIQDLESFKKYFDIYNKLKPKSNILGLGNFCRIHWLNNYVREALKYAFENSKIPRIHVYGLGLRLISYTFNLALQNNIQLSIDSTKWTRACSTELRKKYYPKFNAVRSNRQEFFDEYQKIITKKIDEEVFKNSTNS